MALLSTVVAEIGPVSVRHGRPVPHLVAYHAAFLTAAAIGLLAAVAALRIDDSAAAHTMVRRSRPARAASPASTPAPAAGA